MFLTETSLVGAQIDSVTFVVAGIFQSNTPWRHADRTNHNYELIIGINETQYLEVAGETIQVNSGDVLLIPPHTPFSGQRLANGGLSFYWLHFELPQATELELQSNDTIDNRQLPPILWPLYSTNLALNRELVLMHQLIITMRNQAEAQLLLNALAKTILLGLSETAKQAIQAKQAGNHLMPFIMDWIERHLDQRLTVEEVANHFGYNKAYLSHLFSTKVGMTMTGYIHYLRIEKAKGLLHASPYSIKEIAHLCGFEDEKYFSRVFKKVVNIPPHHYRNKHQFD
ncbi:AraC-type DNA-binding protein [Amphibacillus marinus]|uniref:AraC-type DNA-binding protein n=1 Tax=Amphibacillus marinus TaxID=872970 RepID=A0A1H8LEJ5_9BACI|nr:AraC family transcriptional regulator [Amphibacillus marinus]SEO03580.1 AraC-type DNA-binding protein [Amphibacillus marinus]